jgi:hypothetical protein
VRSSPHAGDIDIHADRLEPAHRYAYGYDASEPARLGLDLKRVERFDLARHWQEQRDA